MKKRKKTILICIAAVPLIWGVFFSTDYFLVTKAHKDPLFCIRFGWNYVGLGYSYLFDYCPTIVECDGFVYDYTLYIFGKACKHVTVHIPPEELGY